LSNSLPGSDGGISNGSTQAGIEVGLLLDGQGGGEDLVGHLKGADSKQVHKPSEAKTFRVVMSSLLEGQGEGEDLVGHLKGGVREGAGCKHD
jgi:hypothetical protein